MSKNPQQALTFFIPRPPDNTLGAIYFDTGISAGFPSPADDFKQERLSLDSELIKNKEATFFARVCGQSMIDAGLTFWLSTEAFRLPIIELLFVF